MAEDANSRDARRRRRILQQGSDRLAFISGRINTLPDSSSSSLSQPHPLPPPPPPPPPPSSSVHHSDSSSQIPKLYDPDHDHDHDHDTPQTLIQTPPLPEVPEISTIPSSEPEPEPEPEPVPEPERVQLQPPPSEPERVQLQPSQSNEPKRVIIPNDITRAINASRVTRLYCSILVALLVLASYFLRTQFLKTVIGFRPLYLVLVTNLTVVIARLFSGEQSVQRRLSTGSSGGDQYAQLANMLELCLLAKNVADAVFMDCAVYVVVLVCGLSVLRT